MITTRTTAEFDVLALEAAAAQPLGRACIVFHCEGQAEVVQLHAPHDSVVVGRSFPADVHVPNKSLSRQHARFSWSDGVITVEDLDSLNGTWLRGERIAKRQLASGDEVMLGNLKATISLIAGERTDGPSEDPDRQRRETPAPPPPPASDIVLVDPAMQDLYRVVARVAKGDVAVLVLGETGTGKEHVASSLHTLGPRANKPFKVINCGAIPENLTGSILFGYEKGAFTGAYQRTAGVFEEADGGTVFLDEIGELPLQVQATLLRVLEAKKVTRIGANEEIPVDVRVVTATHCDVVQMVEEKTFREDLLYRLNAITLEVPALRDRRGEIAPLCEHFVRQAASDWERATCALDPEALVLLQRYSWPGNIRQLRNVIERAVLLCSDERIMPSDLPESVRNPTVADGEPMSTTAVRESDPDGRSFKDQVRALEIKLIRRAMERSGGNQRAAAKLLRMPRRTLVYKLKAYELATTTAPNAAS